MFFSRNKNLVSASKFAKDNFYFEFHLTFCFAKSHIDHSIMLQGYLGQDGLISVSFASAASSAYVSTSSSFSNS